MLSVLSSLLKKDTRINFYFCKSNLIKSSIISLAVIITLGLSSIATANNRLSSINCIDNNNPPKVKESFKHIRGIGPSRFVWRAKTKQAKKKRKLPDGECTIQSGSSQLLAIAVDKKVINGELKCIISGKSSKDTGARGKSGIETLVMPFKTGVVNQGNYRKEIWMSSYKDAIYVHLKSVGNLHWNVKIKNDGDSCQILGKQLCSNNSNYTPRKGCIAN